MNRILPYIFLIAVLTSSVSITKAQIGFDPNLFFWEGGNHNCGNRFGLGRTVGDG